MTLEGKGFFTWKVPSCEGGDTDAIAALARSANYTHVLIKIANGILAYNIDPNTGTDYAIRLASSLHQQGIQSLGWHYVYGDNPTGEADIAIQRIQQVKVDGYVIDAEVEYKQPGKKQAAKTFMSKLRTSLPSFPIALSSFRYPSYHKELPWVEFLEKCDYNMPQVYWMKAHNAGVQLTESVRQFRAMIPYRPIIPTGAAFRESGWQPTPAEVLDFLQTAKSLNLSAANFWEWSDCRAVLPDVWNVIRDFSWTGVPVQKDICEKYIDALNTHNPAQIVSLYTPTAVHVTPAQTIQGTAAITAWFNSLFTQSLPSAIFTLTGFSGTGISRHFTWTATSSGGKVSNGNDTFGLINDKIGYHYSFFTISH